MSAVVIRRARLQDLPVLADLLVREFRLYPPGQAWLIPIVRLGIQFDMQQRLTAPKYACLVAIDSARKIVGTLEVGYRAALPWQSDQRPYPYISNLAVRSTMRRQGIAQQLMRASEQLVAGWQARDLYLHVMENNFAARQLYLKSGYVIHQMSEPWRQWMGLPPKLFLHKRLVVSPLAALKKI